MNELNSDMVLWVSFGVLALTIVTFLAYGLKAFITMSKKKD